MKRVMLFGVVPVLLLALLSLGVFAESFELAKEAFVNATLDLEQLRAEGLPYASIEDHLFVMNESLVGKDEAKVLELAVMLNKSDAGKAKAFEYFRMVETARQKGIRPGQDFALVVREARVVRAIRDSAFESRDVVVQLERDVQLSVAANDSRVLELLGEVRGAFKAEQYGELGGLVNATLERMEDVEVERARERAFLGVARRNFADLVKAHAWGIVFGLLIVLVLCVWAFLELRFSRALRARDWTKKAVKGAEEGLLLAQKKYYAGELGRATYQGRVAQFHEKERDLKAKLGMWSQNVERFRKWSLLGRLRNVK